MPFSISDRDFNGRFPGPATGRPRRPLSSSASTASCNIRFSLRIIISGAPRFNKRDNRLLRLITRLYKSFKSEVAKRPPSNCTIGRNSGGMTGMTSIIIHSGLFPECRNDSTTSKRRIAFKRRCPVASRSSSRNSLFNVSKSKARSSSCTAAAPIPTRNLSPYISKY